jgi:hypothetical protein
MNKKNIDCSKHKVRHKCPVPDCGATSLANGKCPECKVQRFRKFCWRGLIGHTASQIHRYVDLN